ncbi:unnamed protein product [Spirodela intermedia]|uniref:Uncharacterized protein n=1 Tax=Spirodela intermedia TaxID=51605 RepID=A0A7I8IGH8_SPIIN|nr:unnamed protein product [Spirodela intermedia]CAA6656505.1 unnamed protein product [Spirodela intermedia]
MAYRRKKSNPRSSTLEDFASTDAVDDSLGGLSLAAQAIRASSAHRDSSLSSAYDESAISLAYRDSDLQMSSSQQRDTAAYEYTSLKNLNGSKAEGFWELYPEKLNLSSTMIIQRSSPKTHPESAADDAQDTNCYPESLGALTSSLHYIGGTIGNALEEGLMIVENKTVDIIQETKKLNIRRKNSGSHVQSSLLNPSGLPQMPADHETQLKASRDVANAMAAKAKLLLRELKTVKAELAFAKERGAQLEEENRLLRESRVKGHHHPEEDEDLIRLQLETLLAEKARLAQENSVYARENRFLREIVEYHQLTMQDLVSFNDDDDHLFLSSTAAAAAGSPSSPGASSP